MSLLKRVLITRFYLFFTFLIFFTHLF
jgi:hypothetical protein